MVVLGDEAESRSLFGGAALVLSSQIARAASQWFLVWLFARFGGPDLVGELALALAIATPISILAELSLREVYISLHDRPPFRTFLVVRVATSGVALVATLLVGGVLGSADLSILLPFAVIKFLDSVLDILLGYEQANNRLTTFALGGLANAFGTALLAAVVLVSASEATFALWGSALASLGTVVAFGLLVRRRLRQAAEPRVTGMGPGLRLIRTALPLGLATGISSLLVYVPVLFLSRTADADVIGVYAAAAYAITASNLILTSAQQAWLPGLVIADRASARRLRALLKQTGSRLVGLGSVLGILCVALLPFVMPVLYGPEFSVSMVEVSPLGLSIALVAVYYSANMYLLVRNSYGYHLTTASVGLACAAVAALMLAGHPSVLSAACVALVGSATRASVAVLLSARRMRAEVPELTDAHEGR